jgi:hypothetical protein
MGSTTTAKLADAPAFDGRGIEATFARSEVEDALAGDGEIALRLDIARRNDDADDFEAHTLEISWDRSELEDMLERTSGEAVTLTFDAEQLKEAIDADVEAHDFRERVVILTVAAATAAAGSAGYVLTTQHQQASPTPQAYVYSSAPSELVTDASTGGYTAPETGDAVSRAVGNAESGSDVGYVHSSAPVEQVSDIASSGGGYTQTPELQSDAASGGYAAPTSDTGYVHASAPIEQVSDVASSGGGYTQTPELQSDAATGGFAAADTGDVVSRAVGNAESGSGAGYVHSSAPIEPVSDVASSGGGYTQTPELRSDAAGGGYASDTGDVISRAVGNAESASPASSGGSSAGAASDDTNVPAGIIAGGIALLITGAAFVTGRARFTGPKPA